MNGMKRLLTILVLGCGLGSVAGCERPREQACRPLPVALLIGELRDQDFTVRRCAARALGRLGPAADGAVSALRCALEDEDPTVRASVELALARIEKRSVR